MILGIKVGPQKHSFLDLAQANAPFAEVWFNSSRGDDYTDLFETLKTRHMKVGIHFWGCLPDGTQTNIAYPDSHLIRESMAMIKYTIDIAASNGFQYVNIHPGSRSKIGINFKNQRFIDLSVKPVSITQANELFLEHSAILDAYASSRGVLFTIETVPLRVTPTFGGNQSRAYGINIYELPIETLIQAATKGLFIANDFGHTAAGILRKQPNTLWNFLKNTTVRLASQTKLIHLGFVMPPYNGTDIHDSLDNPLLETTTVIPNKKQMVELLSIFNHRSDIYMLVEPRDDHVKNFFLAKKLLEEAFVI